MNNTDKWVIGVITFIVILFGVYSISQNSTDSKNPTAEQLVEEFGKQVKEQYEEPASINNYFEPTNPKTYIELEKEEDVKWMLRELGYAVYTASNDEGFPKVKMVRENDTYSVAQILVGALALYRTYPGESIYTVEFETSGYYEDDYYYIYGVDLEKYEKGELSDRDLTLKIQTGQGITITDIIANG